VTIAVTGGTGFVGARFLNAATEAGHQVKALARRPQPQREGVTWVEGSLGDGDSLRRLVAGCNSVVHIAGSAQRPRPGRIRAMQRPRHARDAGCLDRGRDNAFRPRLLAGSARAEAVEIRRLEGAIGRPGRAVGPRLGNRPPAGGLRTRRQRDPGAVPDGEASTDAASATGAGLASPCRRPVPAAARPVASGRAEAGLVRARRRADRAAGATSSLPRRSERRWAGATCRFRCPARCCGWARSSTSSSAASGPSYRPTGRPTSATATGSSARSPPAAGPVAGANR
jgi:uncharacterized protein YbjT (DUF2867 family)